MPGQNPNLYDDAPESVAAPAPDAAEPKEESGPTALVPKTLFAGKEAKPGDVFDFEVVAVHEGEVEIKYSTGSGGHQESAPDGVEDHPEGGMSSMLED